MAGENVSHRSRIDRSGRTHCSHDDRTRDRITKAAWEEFPISQNSRKQSPCPDKPKSPDKQQPMELVTDFLGEDRHEFVAKLAYQLWEGRGRPFGFA